LIPFIRRLAVLCLLGVLASVSPARAADTALHVRIETGEHEAVINALSALPGSNDIISAADDKTARIWSATNLAASGLIRPPIGALDEGALYAVTASADLIALGGRIADGKGAFAVQFFSRNGLRPLGALVGMPQPVTALRFSPDGTRLAVGLQDRGGLQVFDVKAQRQLGTDAKYDGTINGLDYDAQNRLVTASSDGRIRLYGAAMGVPVSVELPNKSRPLGIAIAADGKRVVVGDRLKPVVHVLDGANLRPVRTLDGATAASGTPGARLGALYIVALGADGTIFAAGSYRGQDGGRLVRAWHPDGRPRFEVRVANDSVFALLPHADGVIFATGEPGIGRIDATGRPVAFRSSRHMELRDAGDTQFRISYNGAGIELPAAPDGGRLVFDAEARELLPLTAMRTNLAAPTDRAGGITVTEWKNTPAPKINGQPIRMEPSETSRSVAVSALNGAAALGTDFFLRFVAPGRELWRKVAPAPVWAVNVSPDGRRVVAGFGDGTVRWYSASNGAELASLFIEPTTQRWVFWTPEGFFAHDQRPPEQIAAGQPDGRSLIGYARNAADGRSAEFIEIGQLYPVFYRPDMVGLSMRDTVVARQSVADQRERLGDVATILGRGLPPSVAVLDSCGREGGSKASGCPATRVLDQAPVGDAPLVTSADNLLVQYRLQERGGRLGAVVVRRNKAVIAPSVFVAEEAPRTRTEEALIPLGEGLNVIRITPVNAAGQVEASDGDSKEIRVMRVASSSRSAGAQGGLAGIQGRKPTIKPQVTLYVLSVGVGTFKRPELNLANPVNDAASLARLMEGPSAPVYDKSEVTLLTNEQATSANILKAMGDIAAKALPDDLVLIFLAGHGQQVDGRYYFAPVDFGTRDDELFRRALTATGPQSTRALEELFRREGLGQDKMLPAIQSLQAARVAMVLDTCFSASIATEDAVLRRDVNTTLTNTLGHAAGRFVLSSSTSLALDSAGSGSDQPRDAQGHGLFTSFMMRALAGEADLDRSGRIDIYELASFTKRNVEQATQDMRQPQVPAFFFAGSQFFDVRSVGAKP